MKTVGNVSDISKKLVKNKSEKTKETYKIGFHPLMDNIRKCSDMDNSVCCNNFMMSDYFGTLYIKG